MRVALVHDWLTGMRGGERCLDELAAMFPDAELFTLLHVPGTVSRRIEDRPIHQSFVAGLPRAAELYRYYLPLFPAAIERFDLGGFDLVLSSSHCVAKGVRVPAGSRHLCYCFTPMRYVWDLYDDYFGPDRAGAAVRTLMPLVARRLRSWDRATASRVDRYVAISDHIRDRIRRCYGRDAGVVYPPVAVDRFRPAAEREDFYLVVSALVPYKRIDLAIRAFNRLERTLVVVGEGPERGRLEAMAAPHIRFTGRLEDGQVAHLYERCRAFVFTANEDFGITAVEAQAAGAPVIAYAGGGALETVVAEGPGATGELFEEQTVDALVAAVLRSETRSFDAGALRRNAERFRPERFRSEIEGEVEAVMAGAGAGVA